jgi:hypothetical protein
MLFGLKLKRIFLKLWTVNKVFVYVLYNFLSLKLAACPTLMDCHEASMKILDYGDKIMNVVLGL